MEWSRVTTDVLAPDVGGTEVSGAEGRFLLFLGPLLTGSGVGRGRRGALRDRDPSRLGPRGQRVLLYVRYHVEYAMYVWMTEGVSFDGGVWGLGEGFRTSLGRVVQSRAGTRAVVRFRRTRLKR